MSKIVANCLDPLCPKCGTPLLTAHAIGPCNTDPVWKCYTCGYWVHRSYEPNKVEEAE